MLCVLSYTGWRHTALHLAALNGDREVVDHLVSSKCDVNVTNAVSDLFYYCLNFLIIVFN